MHDADYRQLCQGWHPYVAYYSAAKQRTRNANPPRVGFVAFDQYKALLADENGKLSGPRTVLAGFGAGITESLLAVTPTESIKTTL